MQDKRNDHPVRKDVIFCDKEYQYTQDIQSN